MSKVSQQDIYIMKGMYLDGVSIEDIAEKLGRKENTVIKYLDIPEEVEEEKPSEAVKKNNTMFYRRTAAKNEKGVSIMNEGESTRSELEKSRNQSTIGKRFRPVIHKISDTDGKKSK